MNGSNVYHFKPVKQQRHDARYNMHGMAFTRLVHSLIREYGKYENGTYSVDAGSLDISDQKLVISHLESAEWYEWASESSSRTTLLFSEHEKHLQRVIDENAYEVYREDQEEMRSYK